MISGFTIIGKKLVFQVVAVWFFYNSCDSPWVANQPPYCSFSVICAKFHQDHSQTICLKGKQTRSVIFCLLKHLFLVSIISWQNLSTRGQGIKVFLLLKLFNWQDFWTGRGVEPEVQWWPTGSWQCLSLKSICLLQWKLSLILATANVDTTSNSFHKMTTVFWTIILNLWIMGGAFYNILSL